jgi:hypothetical protein
MSAYGSLLEKRIYQASASMSSKCALLFQSSSTSVGLLTMVE